MTRVTILILGITCLLTACSKPKSELPNKDLPVEKIEGVVTYGDGYDSRDSIKILNEDGSMWYWQTMYERDSAYREFMPFVNYPDYDILGLRATSKRGNTYEIIANESNGLKKYVVVDGRVLGFTTTETFILSNAIGFDVPMRTAIDGEELKVDKDYTTEPDTIEGDWLRLRVTDASNGDMLAKGWVRWREGDKILVKIYKD